MELNTSETMNRFQVNMLMVVGNFMLQCVRHQCERKGRGVELDMSHSSLRVEKNVIVSEQSII